MDIRTAKAVANAYGPGWGKSIGPGLEVDLDEVLGKDAAGNEVTPRDVFREDLFESKESEE